jgi:hypothetical protein
MPAVSKTSQKEASGRVTKQFSRDNQARRVPVTVEGVTTVATEGKVELFAEGKQLADRSPIGAEKVTARVVIDDDGRLRIAELTFTNPTVDRLDRGRSVPSLSRWARPGRDTWGAVAWGRLQQAILVTCTLPTETEGGIPTLERRIVLEDIFNRAMRPKVNYRDTSGTEDRHRIVADAYDKAASRGANVADAVRKAFNTDPPTRQTAYKRIQRAAEAGWLQPAKKKDPTRNRKADYVAGRKLRAWRREQGAG